MTLDDHLRAIDELLEARTTTGRESHVIAILDGLSIDNAPNWDAYPRATAFVVSTFAFMLRDLKQRYASLAQEIRLFASRSRTDLL